jgi:hypothetical protein
MLTESEIDKLPASSWMPSRIPVQDALATFVPDGAAAVDPPRPVYEIRCCPKAGGYLMLLPYDGGPFDSNVFHIEAGAWDHVTCDFCNVRIPAMTLCYVTKAGAFQALCEKCFNTHVIA